MKRLLVDQNDILATRVEDIAQPPLEDGECRLSLRCAALTANNVTYAAAGFALKYWEFFPTGEEGQGCLPVWGFAEVEESRGDTLAKGERLYGFWPLAEQAVIRPVAQGEHMLTDAAPHRSELPPVYNRYVRVGEKSFEDEALQALLQPLLATSWLLADWLEDEAYFGADQVIVGSASSKTGLGLCKYLAARDDRPQIVGLTSEVNRDFVDKLGACDAVLTYDEIETLPQRTAVYVDMSGNAEVKSRLHAHLGDFLRHSAAVGISHWQLFDPRVELAGPKPEFFFAPARIEKRRADWGPGVVENRIAQAVRRLAETSGDWLELRRHDGMAAAQGVYDSLARGMANPRDGHVIVF